MENKRLFIMAIVFAIFLSGISMLTKDITPPSAYIVGGVLVVFGLAAFQFLRTGK